ncbi:MAG: hypothetical protein WKF73_21410 [Nocardioidaceae bacterium]
MSPSVGADGADDVHSAGIDGSGAYGVAASRPDGIDPLGVPTQQTEREVFVVALAAVVALLGLCFTVGWIVFNHLQAGG